MLMFAEFRGAPVRSPSKYAPAGCGIRRVSSPVHRIAEILVGVSHVAEFRENGPRL